MRTMLLTLVALTALCGTARAERFSQTTGGKLIELCSGKDKSGVDDCTGYIVGISDAAAFYQAMRPRDGSKGAALPAGGYICMPTTVTSVQLREGVVAWSRQNQGDLGRQASGFVLKALRDTYPCQGGGSKG